MIRCSTLFAPHRAENKMESKRKVLPFQLYFRTGVKATIKRRQVLSSFVYKNDGSQDFQTLSTVINWEITKPPSKGTRDCNHLLYQRYALRKIATYHEIGFAPNPLNFA